MNGYWTMVSLAKMGLRYARYKNKQKQQAVIDEINRLQKEKEDREKFLNETSLLLESAPAYMPVKQYYDYVKKEYNIICETIESLKKQL